MGLSGKFEEVVGSVSGYDAIILEALVLEVAFECCAIDSRVP